MNLSQVKTKLKKTGQVTLLNYEKISINKVLRQLDVIFVNEPLDVSIAQLNIDNIPVIIININIDNELN